MAKPAAPVTFAGYQERGCGRPPLALWTLTAPIGTYPMGTTLCRETLDALGVPVPADDDLCGERALDWLMERAGHLQRAGAAPDESAIGPGMVAHPADADTAFIPKERGQ